MAAIVLLCLSIVASADVFNLGEGFTNLETVTVGDPGNIGELSGTEAYGRDRICGAVGYTYNIGKYEVTAKQYTDFLNNKAKTDIYGLYNSAMWGYSNGCKIQRSGNNGNFSYSVASDWANRPVNYVSYWDACRFTNWLCNGQGNGDTETGAYTLGNYIGYDGRTIKRNAGWTWAVTSEDEWYKAAYYKGGGTNAGYWDYPTKSDTYPNNQVLSRDPGNSANYIRTFYSINSPYYRTNVGEFENSKSAYGTLDQGGNLWEWNESIAYTSLTYACYESRGGAFNSLADSLKASTRRWNPHYPNSDEANIGFRVVQVVPEPASIIVLLGGFVGLFGIRRREV